MKTAIRSAFIIIFINYCVSYSQSVLCFDDTTVENGGLCVMRNGDYSRHLFTTCRGDGVSYFFQEVFCMNSSPALCKETMFSVQTVLGLDLSR